MDVKEYIESGILESVVLGLASPQEQAEVKCLSKIYPEIMQEWISVQRSFEREADQYAIPVSADLRARVLAAVANEKQTPNPEQAPVKEAPIRTLHVATENNAGNPWKWTAAASILLLFGIGSLWFVNYREVGQLNGQLAQVNDTIEKQKQEIGILSLEQQKAMDMQAVVLDGNMQTVEMKGTAMDPSATIKIMYNKDKRKAFIKSVKVPQLPTDKQLQLWAIADGKPVSLGVWNADDIAVMSETFDVNLDNIAMFAVTIEDRGGKPTPTLDQMLVAGAL